MSVLRLSEVDEIRSENGRQLVGWLSQYPYFAKKRVHVVKNEVDKLVIKLYTSDHAYQIVATDERCHKEYQEGEPTQVCRRAYLGCQGGMRKPRPGEDWTRGNDLPDGRFSRELLQSILGAIVFYEAKQVVKSHKPVVVDVFPPEGPSIE